MPKEFATLFDAPTDGSKRLPIARAGDYKDKRYGEFKIAESFADDWDKNLAKLPGHQALVDFDHKADKPSPHRNTEAAGWVTGVERDGDMIYGTWKPTPAGEAAIKDGRYLFTSAVFGDVTDEHGNVTENVLTGVSLTNKPFIKSMPMVSLASDESIQRALDLDPAAALFQKALDGELGPEAQAFALEQPTPEDASVTSAISAAVAAVHKALAAQGKDPDKGDPNDRAVLRSLRRAAEALDDAESNQAKDVSGAKPTYMFDEGEVSDAVKTLDVDQAERDKAHEAGNSLPDKSYPINNTEQLKAAIVLAQSHHGDWKAAMTLIKRRAKELNAEGLLPDSWKSAKNLDADEAPDSQRQMKLTADILKSYGITDETKVTEILALADAGDADMLKVLEAIEAAKPEPVTPEAPKTLEELAAEKDVAIVSKEDAEKLKTLEDKESEPVKSLEERAADAGLALVDEDRLKTLEDASNKVVALEVAVQKLSDDAEAAQKALDDTTWENAYSAAEGQGKAAPSQKDQLRKLYDLDKEGTLKMLADGPQLFTTKPAGKNVAPKGENVPEGFHQEHYELQQDIDAYQQEHNVDFMTALEAVSSVKRTPSGMGV